MDFDFDTMNFDLKLQKGKPNFDINFLVLS